MLAKKASPALGFDTVATLTSDLARAFAQQGYVWCARYLHRNVAVDGQHGTLSPQELNDILAAGLALIPVQLGSNTLVPSSSEGTTIGQAAAANAKTLEIPGGVTLWCDVEWSPTSIPKSDDAVIAYVEAWADAVLDAGYSAGLYVGPNMPLNGDQLYSISGITHYWKSAGRVPWVSNRGFQIVQSLYLTDGASNGISIDADVIAYDAKGDLPVWVSAT